MADLTVYRPRLVSALKKNNITRTALVCLVYLRNLIRLKTLRTPSTLFIFITSRCNARCRHCFYWRELQSNLDMRPDEFRKIMLSLRNNLEILVLTGGEPTLHPKLEEFVESAIKYNNPKIISLPTNGILTEKIEQIALRVCSNHPQTQFEIAFSLDGLRELHDEIRGVRGSFERAEGSIKALKRAKSQHGLDNLRINIVTAVGEYNYRQLDELFIYVRNQLAVEHKIQLVRASSTGVFGVDRQLLSGLDPQISTAFSAPQFAEMKKSLLDLAEKYKFSAVQKLKLNLQLETIERHGNRLRCVAGIRDGIIYSNGDVAICEMLKPLANLDNYHYDFAALWGSDGVRRFVRSLGCSCVHNCNIVSNMQHNLGCLREFWGRD